MTAVYGGTMEFPCPGIGRMVEPMSDKVWIAATSSGRSMYGAEIEEYLRIEYPRENPHYVLHPAPVPRLPSPAAQLLHAVVDAVRRRLLRGTSAPSATARHG